MEVAAEEEVLAARRELSWFPQPSKGFMGRFGAGLACGAR